jgi:protein-disulfide isomerase
VATIGFAGALTMAGLGVAAWRNRASPEDPFRSLLLVLSGFAIVASATMASLSLQEGSFCPFCVIWYGVNVATFAAAWFARNRNYRLGDLIDDCLGGKGFATVAAFAGILLVAAVVHHDVRASRLEEREAEMMKRAPEIAEKIVAELTSKPIKPFDSDHLPTKGAEDPEVRIVEFGDFECPHCKKLWDVLEGYVASTDRKVQVRFANFPLDSKCNKHVDREIHPHACEAAAAALCAGKQDEFWEYGSLLFANQSSLERSKLVSYAEQLGLDLGAFNACLDDPAIRAAIEADVGLGYRLDIRATPTYYVNDVEITGAFPPPLFEAVIDALLAQGAGQSPQ